jgi:hypothetical protein
MFEKSLQSSLKKIFDLDKVTYDSPSESLEQECIFIQVESSRNSIVDGRQIAKVTGKIKVYAQSEKLPYGYFSKKINGADPQLTYGFYFYDFEENKLGTNNLCERSISFVYFFDSQFDPDVGTLNELQFNEEQYQ